MRVLITLLALVISVFAITPQEAMLLQNITQDDIAKFKNSDKSAKKEEKIQELKTDEVEVAMLTKNEILISSEEVVLESLKLNLNKFDRRVLLDINKLVLKNLTDLEFDSVFTQDKEYKIDRTQSRSVKENEFYKQLIYLQKVELIDLLINEVKALITRGSDNEYLSKIYETLLAEPFLLSSLEDIILQKSDEVTLNEFNPYTFKNIESLLASLQKEKSDFLIKRYGEDFFKNRTDLISGKLPIPDDYVVSIGDIFTISVFGTNSNDYELIINSNGTVVFPAIGEIKVKGLSYDEAKTVLTKKVKSFYPNSKVVVLLSSTSSMTVSVVGEVVKPGVYVLNSLSRVKDLLLKSKGVTDIGSMREIEIVRNSKIIAKFDIYDLLIDGKNNNDLILRNDDTLVVPVAKKLVEVKNGVNRAAIYELKDNESLKDLIKYAGGLEKNVRLENILITRISAFKEKKVLVTSLDENIVLEDKDIIEFDHISNNFENSVLVYGNVKNSGKWYFKDGESIKDLFLKSIDSVGFAETFLDNTLLNYFVIKRKDEKLLEYKTVSKNLALALEGDVEHNIKLKSGDEIYIFNKSLVQGMEFVKIDGEIQRANSYAYFKGMTLKDLINAAGTTYQSYKDSIMVYSYTKNYKRDLKYYNLNEAEHVFLKPFDEVEVFNFNKFLKQPTVKVLGEVNRPGIYNYYENMSIKDLINIASNFTNKTYQKSFEITRFKIVNNIRESEVFRVDLQSALERDYILEPYDEILFLQTPGWKKDYYVSILGEVNFPGTYSLKKGEKISDLIKRAGGLTKDAFVEGSVFTREDVKQIQQEGLNREKKYIGDLAKTLGSQANSFGESGNERLQRLTILNDLTTQMGTLKAVGRVSINLLKDLELFKSSPSNVSLKAGDTLIIPREEESILVMGEIMNTASVIYQKDKDVFFYINKSGGIKDSGDDENIFIIRANGESQKVQSGWSAEKVIVQKGDIIIVPLNVEIFSSMQMAKDVTSIIYQLGLSAAAMKTVGLFGGTN